MGTTINSKTIERKIQKIQELIGEVTEDTIALDQGHSVLRIQAIDMDVYPDGNVLEVCLSIGRPADDR